jgi:outer membrane protein, heavy metal efflux system
MKKSLFILITMLGCFLLLLPAAMGASSDPAKIEGQIQKQATIDGLTTYALKNNPEIQAAREKLRVVTEFYRINTAYPDPQLMVTYFPEPIETRLGPQDWNATLSQAIPFPGKLSKAGEMAEADIKIAGLRLRKIERDIAVGIREAIIELNYIRESKSMIEDELALFHTVIETTENAYAQDRTALVDVLMTHTRVGNLKKNVILLNDMEISQTARLNRLLGRLSDASIGILEPIIMPPPVKQLKEMYRLAESNQEDILMADMEIEKKAAGISLAQYRRLPDFKLGLFYAGIGSPDVASPPPDAGEDAVGIQFGLSLPLWSGKNKSRINKAQAEMTGAKSIKSSRIDKIRTGVRTLYFRLKNEQRIMALYKEELLPQAESAIASSETWFMDSKLRFSDFIEAQSRWYDFKLALLKTEADYQKDIVRLDRLIGHPSANNDPTVEKTEER